MFNKWFGKKEESVRKLEQPEDLIPGDMFDMQDSFGLPQAVRGKTFKVVSVNTYEYQYGKETEFLLEGESGEPYHMTVDNEDGEKYITFAMKIERDEVESLFDMAAFSEIFEDEPGNAPIETTAKRDNYERWVAERYNRDGDWVSGYFHQADFRHSSFSQFEDDKAEPFEAITLVSDDDMYSVEIEVWPNGETDVSLCVSRPVADIKELYGKT
ncbi:hypothetical protein FLL45_00595 [Aliikangiella marina]|uniref:DUF4178 domain-containing protein n=1 Tax=Aliikangiella marina TaxID=1712262 RepID=A0A545TH10_9GAMM|nr:hypothetical protein [Aliikangiella marina]TQV76495.1 hypothetical protein FLL45_00595 [Aliikangiella marina]